MSRAFLRIIIIIISRQVIRPEKLDRIDSAAYPEEPTEDLIFHSYFALAALAISL